MMKPGRELDALVAKHVMGYREGEVWQVTGDYATVVDIPKYSEDIAAAWTIIDQIPNHHSLILFRSHEGWTLNLNGGHSSPYGETAQHAICLAALKVVGVE